MADKLHKIGYVPHSKDLSHPADRRRIAFWANEIGLDLEIINPRASNVLFLSSAANFGYWLKRAQQPVILDLVDGYIGENPKFSTDFMRNIVRTFRGSSSFYWITYTRHLKYACKRSSAVIVASEEQRQALKSLNEKIYVIPDSHSELKESTKQFAGASLTSSKNMDQKYIFWEGFGYTIKHFAFMAKELDSFLREADTKIYLVTVEEFPRWGGYIGKVTTKKLIKKMFPNSHDRFNIIPWTIENLNEYARHAQFGVIPIDPSDRFARLKSENKLLSMWTLGLPVLFSDTPSYSRIAKISGSEAAVVTKDSWKMKLDFFSSSQEELSKIQKSGAKYIQEKHSKRNLLESWNLVLADAVNSGSQDFEGKERNEREFLRFFLGGNK